MKIVLALGGNALGNNPEEQKTLIDQAMDSALSLIKEGHDVVISHGNGPQVGMIINSFEKSSALDDNIAQMPFPEAVAMSQGYIGYHIQTNINKKLSENKIDKNVVSLITQVLVDKNDPAFEKPNKPIGPFFQESDLKKMDKNYKFIEDSGRGYRRVVASPKPTEIIEIEIIKELIDKGNIVIAGGGGGIPVYKDGNSLKGVDAVIDKDLVSSKLAIDIGADLLIILTAVDKVAINFNRDNEKWLDRLDIESIDKYVANGEFGQGSMLPKVLAARNFVNKTQNTRALITSLRTPLNDYIGKATVIVK